ncbi:hypothetical protein PENTCL1PPCAC_17825, partial [Pristionchus entomophagus]
ILCKVMSRVPSDECDNGKIRREECERTTSGLGQRIDELVYPDGRSLDSLTWNCPSDKTCCDEYSCCPSVSFPIISFRPYTTTPSPLQSARDILAILLKVCMISAVVCALLSFFIRYYAYLHQRAQIQTGSNADPIPAKSHYTSFPPPSMPYSPSNPPSFLSSPISDPPPPYMAPPPYSERSIQPLPKVA